MSEDNLPLKKSVLNLSPAVHGGLVRKNAQKHGIGESEILDFSASLNPLGTPFEYCGNEFNMDEMLKQALEKIHHYPDNRYLEFRKAASRFLIESDTTYENIVPGNGSSEIIRLVAESVLYHGDRVIIPEPTFSEYEIQCRIFGAEIINTHQDDIFSISDEILEDARIIFVCNPNNPTGKLISRNKLEKLAERCEQKKTLLFIDEAFSELSDPRQSMVNVAIENDYVFVLRSLTKSFAIPGIRMGFGVATQRMAEGLNNSRLSWNLGSVPDTVATELLNMDSGYNNSYFIRSRQLIEEERNYLIERLSNVRGFKPLDSSVNYILVDIEDFLMDSSELSRRLASRGILIRDCSSFRELGNSYIRIAVRPREENEKLIQAIGDVLTGWGREQAREELKHTIETIAEGGSLGRTTCEYYPCHFEDQDCIFCFCPFYPCEDERTGGKMVDRSSGGKIWSCQDCHIIHDKEVAQKILDIFMNEGDNEENLRSAWRRVMEPLL
ncbi:aminotransferase class I and II [Methanosalsum zhilinae DSM 4017]|uniref:threonine-phosphate decarboxylase n=1 Tax=Methanosalsum zhilinae (strain DSM 4017 / NBRC 107636 / OCM 62 / WeN5) TaxID=679901 RepID=F7XNP5_METZD|nr:aminotransferase class I and II [Methanosalsum zhilinae DSM 4017]